MVDSDAEACVCELLLLLLLLPGACVPRVTGEESLRARTGSAAVDQLSGCPVVDQLCP